MALAPIDIAITTAAWAVVIYKAPALRQRDKRALATWLFLCGFAVSLTLNLSPIALALNAAVGIPNLSWLLCYVAVTLALYANVRGCCALWQRPTPRWLHPGLGVVLLTLTALFAGHIAATPEYPDHTLPRSIYDVIFVGLPFLYCALCLAVIRRAFAHLARSEQNLVTRCRWWLIWLAALAGAGFCWTRIGFVILAYHAPHLPGLMSWAWIGDPLLTLSCLIWPCAFGISHRGYTWLAPPLRHIENLLALRDLLVIRARLHRWLPTVVKAVPSWPQCLADPGFHLYETVIAIFDGQKTLRDSFEGVSALPCSARPGGPRAWDGAEELLQALDAALAHVPDERDYPALVAAWRGVARALRR